MACPLPFLGEGQELLSTLRQVRGPLRQSFIDTRNVFEGETGSPGEHLFIQNCAWLGGKEKLE